MRDLKLVVLILFAIVAMAACAAPAANNSVSNNGNKATASNAGANVTAANNSSSPGASQLDGKQIYTENCQICHRDTGKGGPVTIEGKKLKPADLTKGYAKRHSDDDVVKAVQEGTDEGMPAFKDKLKPEQIRAIVGYIRTLQQ